MTSIPPSGVSTDPLAGLISVLGDWVEVHRQTHRRGRRSVLLLNRRDHDAIVIGHDELAEMLVEGPSDELVAELDEAGFLAARSPIHDRRPTTRVRDALLTTDVPWRGAHRWVAAVHRRVLHHAFRPHWFVVQLVVAVAGVVGLAMVLRSGHPLEMTPAAWQVPVVVALSAVAIAVHELGHALVVVHHGRTVRSFGFRLHLGAPSFYCDSADALALPRRTRIVQALAGPWAEWLVTSLWIGVLVFVPAGALTPVLHRFALLNTFDVVSNLLPFGRLDGSLVLGDLIGEPNLYDDSRQSLRRSVEQRRLDDGWLVTYALIDAVVSVSLFALSMLLWWYLFGDLLVTLATGDLLQQLAFVVLAALIVGPLLVKAAGSLSRLSTVDRFRFGRQRRVRIDAIRTMAPHIEGDGVLGPFELGVLAGQLELHRVRVGRPVCEPSFRGWVIVPEGVWLDASATEVSSTGARGLRRIDSPGLIARRRRRLLDRSPLILLPDRAFALVELLGDAGVNPAPEQDRHR